MESDGGPKSFYDSLQGVEDIQRLIDEEARESMTLDYKEANRQWDDNAKRKIAKCVSAFANSEGGTVILGVDCDKSDEDKPVEITGLHDKNSVETFDRILTDAIKPEIEGWQRKFLSDGTKSVLVVSIPQSDRAPHMSQKHKRYYHRSGAQSLAMENHLVALYFGRRRRPSLDIRVVEPLKRSGSADQNFTAKFEFHVCLDNLGTGVASGASGVLRFPRQDLLRIQSQHSRQVTMDEVQNRDKLNRPCPTYYFDVNTKVFPKSTRMLLHFFAQFTADWRTQYANKPLFEWEVYAEDSEPKSGTYEISSELIRIIQDEHIPQ